MNEPNHGPVLALEKITRTFHQGDKTLEVLKCVDLILQRGEIVALVGQSGSGKSTLLNMITGIDHPSQGRMVIRGTDIEKEILRYASKSDADAIFLNSDDRLGEKKLDILRHAPTPIMIVPVV